MRTPVGSSNSSARSLRHNSPVWLPSGVTLTSPDDWPVATRPSETQINIRRGKTTRSDRTRIMTSNRERRGRRKRLNTEQQRNGDETEKTRCSLRSTSVAPFLCVISFPPSSPLPAHVQSPQQLPRGIGLLRPRIQPRDAETFGAR